MGQFNIAQTVLVLGTSGKIASSITAPAGSDLTLTAGSGNQNVNIVATGSGATYVKESGGSAVNFWVVNSDWNGSSVGQGLNINMTSNTGNGIARIDSLGNGGSVGRTLALQSTAGQPVIIGSITNNANGILQIASSTSATAGIAFGADVQVARSGANSLRILTNNAGMLDIAQTDVLIGSGVGSTATLSLQNGTGTAPSLRGTNFSTTGLAWSTGPNLLFVTNGATALTIDASQNLFVKSTIYSSTGQNLVFSTNSGGTAVTIASSTLVTTFSGGVVGTGATGGSQGAGTGNFTALYENGVAVSTGGNVSTTGSPAATQVALFTNGTTIQGLSNLVYTAGAFTVTNSGTATSSAVSSTNGAVVELITTGLNSVGTARSVHVGLNKFADDVYSWSDGTTERLRLGITNGQLTVSSTLIMGDGQSMNWGTGTVLITGNSSANTLAIRTNGTAAVSFNSSQVATFAGVILPQQAATASAPSYAKGGIYFDTTLNKLRIGGAVAWETVTSA